MTGQTGMAYGHGRGTKRSSHYVTYLHIHLSQRLSGLL
jgi:hypothetical protein